MNKKIIVGFIALLLIIGLGNAIGFNPIKNTNTTAEIDITYIDGAQVITHPSGVKVTVELVDLENQLAKLINKRDSLNVLIEDKNKEIQDLKNSIK